MSPLIPDEDILYDGEAHGVIYDKGEGVGEFIFTYVNADNVVSYEAPSTEGIYDVYLEIEEGDYFYGKENEKVGSFTIYNFDANEWIALNTLKAQLMQDGFTPSWDMEAGPVAVGKFEGLVIEKGHTVGLNLSEQNLNVFPTALAAFTELKSLNLSHNNLTGNVGILAAAFPNLTSLDVSWNKFTDLYPMISPDVTTLKFDHQNMDLIIPINFSDFDPRSLAKVFPTILMYDHNNQTYKSWDEFVITTSPTRNGIHGKDFAILMILGLVDNELLFEIEPSPGFNTYYGASGDELYVYQQRTDNCFKIALSFEMGDADFFGNVSASDVMVTILYAFGENDFFSEEYGDYPFNFTAADTYTDGNINVQDVICTVNIILSKSVHKSASVMRAPGFASYDAEPTEASIYMEDGNIILDSEKPVAAISVHLTGNVTWSLDKYGLTQSTLDSNVVGYSLDGTTIPAGKTVIGSYLGEPTIEEVSLSDEKAHKITVSISNAQTSGIEYNLNDLIDDSTEIYDITGRRINSLGSGVNIIRKGNRTIKVVGGVIK